MHTHTRVLHLLVKLSRKLLFSLLVEHQAGSGRPCTSRMFLRMAQDSSRVKISVGITSSTNSSVFMRRKRTKGMNSSSSCRRSAGVMVFTRTARRFCPLERDYIVMASSGRVSVSTCQFHCHRRGSYVDTPSYSKSYTSWQDCRSIPT